MKLVRHNSFAVAMLLVCFLLTGYLLTTSVMSQSQSHPCFYYLSMVMHYQSEVISAQDEIRRLENQGYFGFQPARDTNGRTGDPTSTIQARSSDPSSL